MRVKVALHIEMLCLAVFLVLVVLGWIFLNEEVRDWYAYAFMIMAAWSSGSMLARIQRKIQKHSENLLVGGSEDPDYLRKIFD